MIVNGSNSTTLTLIPSWPCRSRQPERALRSWAAYITSTASRDSQQHVGICILRDTPANYSCSLFLVCCLGSFWLRDLRPHRGLVAPAWPALTAAHPWTYIHWVCILRAICNLFLEQMLRCLYITLAWSVSEDPQAAPQYVNSMRDNCALSTPPQIISSQFPHSCVCIVVWLRRTFLMPAKFRG